MKSLCELKVLYVSVFQLVVWVDPLDGTKEYTEGKSVPSSPSDMYIMAHINSSVYGAVHVSLFSCILHYIPSCNVRVLRCSI